MAFLNKEVIFIINDEHEKGKKSKTFIFGGIKGYIKYLHNNKNLINKEIC